MTTGYKHYLITTGFDYIYDNEELMDLYYQYTGKEYNNLDDTMINILREKKIPSYKLYHVKQSFTPYIVLGRHLGYETICFDLSRYKLDMIKKILSSETSQEDSLMLIENLVFQDIKSPILSDSDYLSLLNVNLE